MNFKNTEFSGSSLRIARLVSGLSLNDLGTKVGATRQYIQQLETTSKVPSQDLTKALAYELRVRPDFFFKSINNQVMDDECHFRKLKSTLVSTKKVCSARATLLNRVVEFLDQHITLPKVNFPHFDVHNSNDIENAASECRELWGLGSGPIKNMVRVAENAGAIISTFSEISDTVDALSVSRMRPILFLNTSKSPARQRLDIGHEMAHMLFHQGIETGDRETESQANTFASYLLLPRHALINDYNKSHGKRIDWNSIYAMKLKWGISAKAIIYSLHREGILDPTQYRTGNIYFSKTGQTKVEVYDEEIPRETSELLTNSLTLLLDTYGKGFGGLLDDLSLDFDMLAEITQPSLGLIQSYKEKNYSGNVVSITR